MSSIAIAGPLPHQQQRERPTRPPSAARRTPSSPNQNRAAASATQTRGGLDEAEIQHIVEAARQGDSRALAAGLPAGPVLALAAGGQQVLQRVRVRGLSRLLR